MITVVLLRPQHPANVGFICRSMKNFDLSNLILIDPLYDSDDETIRTSKHALDVFKNAKVKPYSYFSQLKKDFDSVVGTTSILGTDYNIARTPLLPKEFAQKNGDQNIALVFGNEGNGLLNEEIKLCDYVVTIPSSKNYPALNISHAAVILFYEIYQHLGENKLHEHIRHASKKDKEVIMQSFNAILDDIDFTTEEKRETQEITWKRVFEKAALSKREAFAVIGLLKKIKPNKSESLKK